MTEKTDLAALSDKLPTVNDLYAMLQEMAQYCDSLKAEIDVLKRDFVTHEHSRDGKCMVPIQR
jgi:hypothetical protein